MGYLGTTCRHRLTDSRAMAGQRVVVVGGANSAGQAAVQLGRHDEQVPLLHRVASTAGRRPAPLVHRSPRRSSGRRGRLRRPTCRAPKGTAVPSKDRRGLLARLDALVGARRRPPRPRHAARRPPGRRRGPRRRPCHRPGRTEPGRTAGGRVGVGVRWSNGTPSSCCAASPRVSGCCGPRRLAGGDQPAQRLEPDRRGAAGRTNVRCLVPWGSLVGVPAWRRGQDAKPAV
jgi:hypothetical protein